MKPFRWNIARREQLGTLLRHGKRPDLEAYEFLDDLRSSAARVLALADDANLAFIGRTPENFFDYLGGVFAGIAETPALHLVQFSLRWAGPGGVDAIEADALSAFMDYLVEEGIDPQTLASAPRPLALVDFVSEGGTMENFVALLKLHAGKQGVDWNAVQRRLRIIGLRERTKNSPNTWRWQQHQAWLDQIPDAVIKNVSAPYRLIGYMANYQPKVTDAFHPRVWRDGSAIRPDASEDHLTALRLAVQLFDSGRDPAERRRLAARIARTRQMRQPATRALVSRLRGL